MEDLQKENGERFSPALKGKPAIRLELMLCESHVRFGGQARPSPFQNWDTGRDVAALRNNQVGKDLDAGLDQQGVDHHEELSTVIDRPRGSHVLNRCPVEDHKKAPDQSAKI